MEIYRKKPEVKPERGLVEDQPGLKVLVAGLTVALVLGLFIRGLIQPEKVQKLLRQASQQIHRDVVVDFVRAQVSLSRGLWPRLSVVIQDVTLRSTQTCWMKPEVRVNEIELPISLRSWLSAGEPVREVLADQVELSLYGEWQNCSSSARQSSARESQTQSNPNSGVQVTLLNKQAASPIDVKSSISRIRLNRLSLNPVYYPEAAGELLSVDVQVASQKPQVLRFRAKTQGLRDQAWGDFAAHALVEAEYSEFPKKVLQWDLSGTWREGNFLSKIFFDLEEHTFKGEVDVSHLPLAKLGGLGRGLGMQRFEALKKVWLSSDMNFEGRVGDLAKLRLEVKDFLLEADTGEIQSDLLEFSDGKIKPFTGVARDMPVAALVRLIGPEKSSPWIHDLGRFSGSIRLKSLEEISFNGDLSGVALIFSNLGRREIQKFDLSQIELERSNHDWRFKLNRVDPIEGFFVGQIEGRASEDFSQVQIKLETEEFSLSPSVNSLMGLGGSLGNWKTRLDFQVREGGLEKLNGQWQIKEMSLGNFYVPLMKGRIRTADNRQLQATVQIPELRFNALVGHGGLESLWPQRDSPYEYKSINLNISFIDFSELQWKEISGLQGNQQLRSQGGWTREGVLYGQIHLRSPQESLKYKISGHRDRPEFIKY